MKAVCSAFDNMMHILSNMFLRRFSHIGESVVTLFLPTGDSGLLNKQAKCIHTCFFNSIQSNFGLNFHFYIDCLIYMILFCKSASAIPFITIRLDLSTPHQSVPVGFHNQLLSQC